MNSAADENEFRRGVQRLLEGTKSAQEQIAPNPYQGVGEYTLHEHDTRSYFFDGFLSLLGWSLGPNGDVTEEVRIKAETTKFIDYLGLNDQTGAPVMIFEAKAWGKPFIRGKDAARKNMSSNLLLVEAIKHVAQGGKKKEAPVIGDWHEYLEQLAGYVQTSTDRYGHRVTRAVLSSGDWLIVFIDPTAIFCNGNFDEQSFRIFKQEKYVEDADHIFRLLSRKSIGAATPLKIRSTQLNNYVTAENVSSAHYSVFVNYEESGIDVFSPRPRIQVYPAVVLLRNDGAILTVMDSEDPLELTLEENEQGEHTVNLHISNVELVSSELLRRCSDELGTELAAAPLENFAGFPKSIGRKAPLSEDVRHDYIKPLRSRADQWQVITGDHPHFLFDRPTTQCSFHSWSNCRSAGCQIGDTAISSRVAKGPRAFFTDEQIYHCAHQEVQDRRQRRCKIAPIDMRTCCRACVFQNSCWSEAEKAALPCGRE